MFTDLLHGSKVIFESNTSAHPNAWLLWGKVKRFLKVSMKLYLDALKKLFTFKMLFSCKKKKGLWLFVMQIESTFDDTERAEFLDEQRAMEL